MRFTIERLRSLVLAAGILLVGALIAFLARGRLRNPLNLKELPQRLGVNIQSDATTFTIDHAMGGRSRYRIHAAKAVQYKDNRAILRDVQIEIYGEDGNSVDRIQGAEFEYDQKNGKATASGPVDITLSRPAALPDKDKDKEKNKDSTVAKPSGVKNKPAPTALAAEAAERGEVHVKTSGLTFDTQSGVAHTAERVDFSTAQGSGSAIGASYDSKGFLVLDKAVALNTQRGGETVEIHAEHAEFERATLLCQMQTASANYRGGEARAGSATILFRDDGSAVRLDATNGFNLVTQTGAHIAAPSGTMEFDEHNQPRHGHLQGGVRMDSSRPAEDGAGERRMRASAPRAELDFSPTGELRHAHLERGVEMGSEQVSNGAKGMVRLGRTWQSPLADLEFRDNGHGQAEPATIHGVEGVVITGETQRGNAPPEPSRLAADDVRGEFGPNSVLKAMTGTGHAALEQTNAAGTRQTSIGDKLTAQFAAGAGGERGAGQVQSALIDGHVVLTQTAAAKTAEHGNAEAQPPLRAWAGRAAFDGVGEWLHLTLSPRVEDGGLQMTADKIDVAHQSGDAFAHGNVKATWLGSGRAGQPAGLPNGGASQGAGALGGQGAAHVIAAEAQLSHAAGSASTLATFSGHARLWQQANSVAAPVIVLDREKQTLTAHSADPNEPVKVVLLSSGGNGMEPRSTGGKEVQAKQADTAGDSSQGSRAPSVIRVRGGDLKYSDAEHKAVMVGGALGTVVAETPTATSSSNRVELFLLPAGNHAGKDGGQSQVDHMIASGRVLLTSGGRRGVGEQLLYTGETGEYVLTGTSTAPPKMTDPSRGTVTGEALVFHSRDDRVSIEGGGSRTTTETTAPK